MEDVYGFDVQSFQNTNDGAGPLWNPSSENADDTLMQGTTRKVSAPQQSAKDSSGWFSCRAVVMGPPKCIICKPGQSGKPTTMIEASVMLADHPSNPEGVRVNNTELTWIEDEGITLVVSLIERGQQVENGVAHQKTVLINKPLRLHRGSIFAITFFGKEKLREKDSVDLPCDFGDILRISGITRKLRAGDKPDQRTGRPRFFESINAGEVVHLGRVWDAEWEPFQSVVYSTFFNWVLEMNVPCFKRMEIPDNVDYAKLAEDKRKKKEEAAAKTPQKPDVPATTAASSDPNNNQPPTDPRQRFAVTRALVLPTAEDGYEVSATQVNVDDIRDAGDDALTFESKKFKWDNSEIFVPLHVIDPRIISYLRKIGYPFAGYMCQPLGAMRLDPTHRDSYRRERKLEAGKPAPPPDAPKVYEPYLKLHKRVLQMMPPGSPSKMQEVDLDATAFPETLRFFGICDPVAQMEVLPYLAATTPAILRTWINGRLSADRSAAMNDPNRFAYVLTASTKRFYRAGKDGPMISKPQVGLIADHACGIVSAGYRISQKAACEILDVLGKRPEYSQVTDKVQRQVAADMANPRIKNLYGKGKPDQLNPINNLVQDPPVVNCCESNINWTQYGDGYHFWVVSNWAEKNFAKYPQLLQVIDQMIGRDPTSQFSKIFVEIAKTGTLSDPELLSYFGPSAFTEYKTNERGVPTPVPILPRPTPAELPFQCVVFAMRKDYVKNRGFEHYYGDNAFVDVIGKCEDYLKVWEQRVLAQRGLQVLPPPSSGNKRKPEDIPEATVAHKKQTVDHQPTTTQEDATADDEEDGEYEEPHRQVITQELEEFT